MLIANKYHIHSYTSLLFERTDKGRIVSEGAQELNFVEKREQSDE